MIVILTTLRKKENAIKIGSALLQEQLIVCYNLFPVRAASVLQGKLVDENETIMVMKTRGGNFDKVEAYIKDHSTYEVPDVIPFTPDKVNFSYLKWVDDETN